MGYWRITIEGIGPHDNADLKEDADRMAGAFVSELMAAGQNLQAARFELISPMSGAVHSGKDLLPEQKAKNLAAMKADFEASQKGKKAPSKPK